MGVPESWEPLECEEIKAYEIIYINKLISLIKSVF